MQISDSPPTRDRPGVRAGDLVVVRRTRWHVVDVRAYEDCHVVTLRGLAPRQGLERRVLTPFDTVLALERRHRARFVGRVRWRRACRALVSADVPPGSLRAASAARMELMPHQLEPALAVVRGKGSRLLLADDVGLGKTVQAGLVVSELLARGAIARVLILTPAGLREQWADELARRFAIAAAPVDGRVLRRLATTLPIGVNPWSTLTAAIASVDYVKRPEVLPAVAACPWDIVVVDEAHGVAGDSDRHAAVHALASSASYVLLLTATPHSGDRRAFEALCELGSVDSHNEPSLLVFRRTRHDVGTGTARRVHIVRVKPSPEELRMHTLLTRYSDTVRRERGDDRRDVSLALSVLHKRALSSAWSLAQSVDRRLSTLAPSNAAQASQLALPLGDPYGELVAADEPPSWPPDLRLSDPRREQRMLSELAAVARDASRQESKVAALCRLLRRAHESAVVFTEYRDTLMHLRRCLAGRDGIPTAPIVLHGGLSREERAASLSEFARATGALLLATDAAAEGLNLHRGCRLVVNLELPWNPMRLEQRIGRVDRIGQARTVHAFHLIAADTGETRILSCLRARVAAARADLGAPDPLGDDAERAIARLVVTGGES
jgi:SNF2 family DNA or RNA helicase